MNDKAYCCRWCSIDSDGAPEVELKFADDEGLQPYHRVCAMRAIPYKLEEAIPLIDMSGDLFCEKMDPVKISHNYVIAMEYSDGSAYACIPQLGSGTFNGCGDTAQEALLSLESCYQRIRPMLEREQDWIAPEPLNITQICERINPPSPRSPLRRFGWSREGFSYYQPSPHELTETLRYLWETLSHVVRATDCCLNGDDDLIDRLDIARDFVRDISWRMGEDWEKPDDETLAGPLWLLQQVRKLPGVKAVEIYEAVSCCAIKIDGRDEETERAIFQLEAEMYRRYPESLIDSQIKRDYEKEDGS